MFLGFRIKMTPFNCRKQYERYRSLPDLAELHLLFDWDPGNFPLFYK